MKRKHARRNGFRLFFALLLPLFFLHPAFGAEEASEYHDIPFDAWGPEVLELQTRLKSLQYYLEGMYLEPEHFDADTQRAVELFCAQNQVSYGGQGASAALQQIIFSDSAKAYAAPEAEAKPLTDRISDYMMRDTDVAVTVVPMYVVWLAGAVLVILILAAILHFFVQPGWAGPRRAEQEAEGGEKQPNSHRADPVPVPLREDRRNVRFQVKYRGNVKNLTLDCSAPVTVGRGSHSTLVLDAGDLSASSEHCSLYYKGGLLMLRDCSTNGTVINGNPISNCEFRVTDGSVIQVGNHQITVEFERE